MKKFFKFCGITALVLVIVGGILLGIGSMAAGMENISAMVEDMTGGKVVMDLDEGVYIKMDDSKIGAFLKDNAIYDIDDANMFDKDHDIRKGNVEKTLLAEGAINEWYLELGGCSFELKDSGDDSYYVEYRGKGKSQAYVEDDELYVKALNSNDWNMGNTEECLTLYVPMQVTVEEVEVDLGAGQMMLDDLKVKDITIDLGAGQVLSENLQAEKVSISVGAGEVVLSEVVIKDVQAEVGAGNCEIQGTVNGNIEAECAMGNMTFELEGDEEEFNYDIECVTGNITIGDKEYSGLAQEQSINNNAAKNIDLECAMGNVEILFE